jgi:hypothetical protein
MDGNDRADGLRAHLAPQRAGGHRSALLLWGMFFLLEFFADLTAMLALGK